MFNVIRGAFIVAVMATVSIFTIHESKAGLFDALSDAFDVAKKRRQTYEQVQDKTMVDAFYWLSEDGKEFGINKEISAASPQFKIEQLAKDSITIKQKVYHAGSLGEVSDFMSGYSYDGEGDAIAQKYVAVAKSRGNIVKLYKPALGGIINRGVPHPFSHANNTREWFNLDNALIEYNPSGRIVSYLVRSYQAYQTLGSDCMQYTAIYTGSTATRALENGVKNSAFQDNFLRELN